MTAFIGRRPFITLLGGAVAAWPLTARAQQAGKLPTIGFLGAGSAATWKPWLAAFAQRLHELGWVEGRTITVEHHWAEGRGERFACRKTGHIGHPDCLYAVAGPGPERLGRFSRATGRQRHWTVESVG